MMGIRNTVDIACLPSPPPRWRGYAEATPAPCVGIGRSIELHRDRCWPGWVLVCVSLPCSSFPQRRRGCLLYHSPILRCRQPPRYLLALSATILPFPERSLCRLSCRLLASLCRLLRGCGFDGATVAVQISLSIASRSKTQARKSLTRCRTRFISRITDRLYSFSRPSSSRVSIVACPFHQRAKVELQHASTLEFVLSLSSLDTPIQSASPPTRNHLSGMLAPSPPMTAGKSLPRMHA